MDASRRLERRAGEEWWDAVIRAAVVWGAAFVIAELADHALTGLVTRPARVGICSVVVFSLVGGFFWGGERWPRWRDSFLGWRYPIAMLLAAYVGYQWHAYDYIRSEEARLNEAARWACAKSTVCQKAAVDYLVGREID